jgi:Rieske Fe-S protein
MNEPVRIFKCPCLGNKYKLAGEPNDNPTNQERKEYADYITAGCTVVIMSIEQFRKENWQWCPLHFDKSDK